MVVAVAEQTEPLRTVNEAASDLGLSRRTVYTLIQTGELRSLKIRGARRVEESEIARFKAERTQGGA